METLKANDLRVYNILMHKNKVSKVRSISNSVISLEGRNYWVLIKDCKPVPLTEDWLIRAGFVRHNLKDVFYSKSYGTNGVAIVKFEPVYDRFCYQLGTGHNRVLDYVHQLQGLHFYVTGTELEFKPE